MGSGFSACSSVSVRQSLRSAGPCKGPEGHDPVSVERSPSKQDRALSQSLNSLRGQSRPTCVLPLPESTPNGLSDSCDSGIFEINRKRHQARPKSSKDKKRSSVSPPKVNPVNKGMQLLMKKSNDGFQDMNEPTRANQAFFHSWNGSNGTTTDTRYNRPISKPGSLRKNPKSEPNLLQVAINEVNEDEEVFLASRPQRPKSAHVRRKRAAMSARTNKSSRASTTKGSDGESSNFSDGDDFDSDVLSIPDETEVQQNLSHSSATNVKLGPMFENVSSGLQGQGDWWTSLTPLEDDEFFVSEGHGSFTTRLGENGFAKKASERSLSSVILLSPVEIPDCSPGTPLCLSPRRFISPRSPLHSPSTLPHAPLLSSTPIDASASHQPTESPTNNQITLNITPPILVVSSDTTAQSNSIDNSGYINPNSNSNDNIGYIHPNSSSISQSKTVLFSKTISNNHLPSISEHTVSSTEHTSSFNETTRNIAHQNVMYTQNTTTGSPQKYTTEVSQNLIASHCTSGVSQIISDPLKSTITGAPQSTISTNILACCAPTNSECCADAPPNSAASVSTTEKSIRSLEEHVFTQMVALSQKDSPLLLDYQTLVLRSRPRFLQVVSEHRHNGMTTSAISGGLRSREAEDISSLQHVECWLAECLYSFKDNVVPGAVSHLVVTYLKALDGLMHMGTQPKLIQVGEGKDSQSTLHEDESGMEDEGESSDTGTDQEACLSSRNSRKHTDADNKITGKVNVVEGLEPRLSTDRHNVTGLPPTGYGVPGSRAEAPVSGTMSSTTRARTALRRAGNNGGQTENKLKEKETRLTKSRPDSGIVVSSSASYSSSEATREAEVDVTTQTEWIAKSLEMLEQVYLVRTENHDSIKSLVRAVTKHCTTDQLKAHALYRWLSSQSLNYYKSLQEPKPTIPTAKLKQLAEGRLSYASLYQEMARALGLRCEKIDGYVKGKDYKPGSTSRCPAHQHSWNAVSFNGHWALLDVKSGSMPYKFFVEHFFMTPPDEFRLSHCPKDKKWLLMNQVNSVEDFDGTLKTWPAMFAFNIRPLNMRSVIKSYDGRLSITVLLRNVAVTPQLDYDGPGPAIDSESLSLNIDQEIRSVDNAETFHVTLPQEGVYYFTLLVHDIEEDEDIPVFQYRVDYKDELL